MSGNILIIEKDINNIKLIKESLESEYNLKFVDSFEEAMVFMEDKEIEMLIVDTEDISIACEEVVHGVKVKIANENMPIVFLVRPDNMKIYDVVNEKNNIDIVLKPIIPLVLLTRVKVQMKLKSYRMNMENKLNEKTKMIESLQDIVFMSMAELVESRDETTGGHVKRTAKYVEFLVKELVSRNIYSDVLVDSYVKDMVRSAPLHDLGKIGISDKTLLKNGSLDEEEMEYMKKHSSLGGAAIQKMIDQATECSFLIVAKDIAKHHHEKWDGTGYPDGLKGEDIPVCARIMALADIYDALTTKRPYKEEMSHEKAVEIILNGRNTSLDPIIVDVFKEVHHGFRKIKEQYGIGL